MKPATKNYLLAAVLVLIVTAVFVGAYAQVHRNTDRIEQQVQSRVAGCERQTADRIDGARVAAAQAAYLAKVLAAASVQEDVKRAVRNTIQKWRSSAEGLRHRLFQCRPLVEQDRKVVDRAALREAGFVTRTGGTDGR